MKIQYGSQWNNDVISHCCIEIARLDTNTVRFVIKDIDNGRVTWTLATSRSQNNCLKCTSSLRKQPTFSDAATSFPTKWCLRNERRNSILMTRHCPDLGSASDWSCRVVNLIQPIRSTTQIWVVTRHQYGISALVSQTSFGGETSGSVAKYRLFSQASALPENGNKIDDCLGKDNFFTLWSSPPLWNVWFSRHTTIRCPLVSHPVHSGKLLSRAVISSCCCHADLKIIFKSY